MRRFLALVLVPAIVAACTVHSVKDDFGTSALAPAGDIPPEFAEFQRLRPASMAPRRSALCDPYQPLEEKSLVAASGRLVQAAAACQTTFRCSGRERAAVQAAAAFPFRVSPPRPGACRKGDRALQAGAKRGLRLPV